MPSTLVHVALGALVAAGLLGEEFDARALGVVLAAAALPDLDTFIGVYLPGTHRALLHTALVPAVAVVLVLYDTRVRERPFLATPRAVRLAWAGLAAYALAGIGPDLFTNGANVLYPVHDRFVSLSGRVFLSDQRGLVQTVWGQASLGGTTRTVHYTTGVDLAPGPDPRGVERVFPLADSGFQLLIVLVGAIVAASRLWTARNA